MTTLIFILLYGTLLRPFGTFERWNDIDGFGDGDNDVINEGT
jgi:hypothetical protein